MLGSRPLRVVAAGGGIATAEFALALHALAPGRVELTIVTPGPDLVMRPHRTAEPFSTSQPVRYPLSALAERTGAKLVADTVTAVEPGSGELRLGSGAALAYDRLVLAIGARPAAAYTKALTFRGDRASISYASLLADLEQGFSRSLAFVVPPGVTWPLPLYELALLTAREVASMGLSVELALLTPELRPLDVFGSRASAAVGELLTEAGIAFAGDTEVAQDDSGEITTAGGRPLEFERVVALPVLEGVAISGVPVDSLGFIPIDERCRVRGLADTFAAGDGSSSPVKQGGIACQQADAIAEQIASEAGADVTPQPLRAVLHGRLLHGRTMRYLSDDAPGDGSREEPLLFAASRKVDGLYLSPWLAEVDASRGIARQEATAHDPGESITVDIEVPHDAPDGVGGGAQRA